MLCCLALVVFLSYFCTVLVLSYTVCSICAVLAGEACLCKLGKASLVQVSVHKKSKLYV